MPWPKPRFQRIARFAPFIGLVIGALQSGLWIFLSFLNWPTISKALLAIALGTLLTGGLHLDGLIDTADGLAAGKGKRLEAMRDSRVGAIGVQALLIVILIQIAALIKLDLHSPIALPIAAFWARGSQLWAIGHFKYLHPTGMASFHSKNAIGWQDLKPSLLVLLIAITSLIICPVDSNLRLPIIAGIGLSLFPAFLVPHSLGILLGGHSGDSYGASLVIVETIILLELAFIFQAI